LHPSKPSPFSRQQAFDSKDLFRDIANALAPSIVSSVTELLQRTRVAEMLQDEKERDAAAKLRLTRLFADIQKGKLPSSFCSLVFPSFLSLASSFLLSVVFPSWFELA
jgi:hypothetical protein